MTDPSLDHGFSELSTPLVFDACLRLDVPVRCSPPGLRPVLPRMKAAGIRRCFIRTISLVPSGLTLRQAQDEASNVSYYLMLSVTKHEVTRAVTATT